MMEVVISTFRSNNHHTTTGKAAQTSYMILWTEVTLELNRFSNNCNSYVLCVVCWHAMDERERTSKRSEVNHSRVCVWKCQWIDLWRFITQNPLYAHGHKFQIKHRVKKTRRRRRNLNDVVSSDILFLVVHIVRFKVIQINIYMYYYYIYTLNRYKYSIWAIAYF